MTRLRSSRRERLPTARSKHGWVFCVLASVWWPAPLAGFQARTAVTTRWSVEAGLPQASVTGIVQDQLGYLWLTTFGGLARFDGARFVPFTIANTNGIGSNRFVAIERSENGRLIALWDGEGFTEVNADTIRSYRHPLLPTGEARRALAMAPDREGGWWFVGTLALSHVRDGRQTALRIWDVPLKGTVSAAVDDDGTLWIGSGTGVSRFRGGNIDSLDVVWEGFTHDVEVGSDGWIMVGADVGLLRIDRDMVVDTLTSEGPVQHIARSPTGSVVFIEPESWTMGIIGNDDRGRRLVRTPLGFPRDAGLRTMFLDSRGEIWFGTDRMGLYRVAYAPVRHFDATRGLAMQAPAALLEADDGAVWVTGGTPCELWQLTVDGGAARVGDVCGTAVMRDSTGAVWFGSRRRLLRLENGRQDVFELSLDIDVAVTTMLAVDDTLSWIGTTDGLFRFTPESVRRFGVSEGLPSSAIASLSLAPDGAVWVGTAEGLSRFAEGRFTTYGRDDGMAPGVVRAQYWDADGLLWTGTYGGGLGRFDGTTFIRFTTMDGLADDIVSAIVPDDAGRLWLSGNRGIVVMSRDELNAFATGEIDLIIPLQLYGSDLGIPETNGNAWLHTRDGRVWFPTISGVVAIDPSAAVPAETGPPIIEAVRIDGRTYPVHRPVDASPGHGELEVEYTSINFGQSDVLRFRYRLSDVDDNWVNVADRRTAFYTNVPPGVHTFEVAVSRTEGGWSDPAALQITFRPFFYQTTWFAVVVVGLVAGGLFQAHRWRLHRLRKHRDALRQSEARFRGATDGSLDGFFLLESIRDTEGQVVDFTIIDVNRRATHFLGRSDPSELAAKRLCDVWPEARSLGTCEQYARVVETGVPFEEERQAISADVTAEWIRQQVVRVGDGLAVTIRDLTPERQAAQERERLQEQLTQAQKLEAVGLLAGGVAHDFNNILMVVAGNTELAVSVLPEDSPARVNLREVIGAADRGARLTQQLLAFTRRQVTTPRRVDPSEQVVALDHMIRSMLGKEIELVTLPADSAPSVWIDPTQLEQVLLNLVVNARDAMPEGGTLTVTVGTAEVAGDEPDGRVPRPGNYVTITVRDTGVGIPANLVGEIFDPFFTTKGARVGTGLGLATSKRIVEDSGGVLSVQSREGQGTTFTIYLPVVEGRPDDGPAVPPSDESTDAGAETLLLLEDTDELRQMMQLALEARGYTVRSTGLPSEAYEAFQEDPSISMLIADVVLPRESGIAVAKKLMRMRPDLKVLFVSGFLGDARQEELVRVGGMFLAKPFTPSVLARRVREILDDRTGAA